MLPCVIFSGWLRLRLVRHPASLTNVLCGAPTIGEALVLDAAAPGTVAGRTEISAPSVFLSLPDKIAHASA